ncbi:unnamed protein product [Coregonus sp. 'balchen']|nr:unnamed protein product [Coregonus sp. 'balchen']
MGDKLVKNGRVNQDQTRPDLEEISCGRVHSQQVGTFTGNRSTLPQAAGQHFHRQQVNTSTGSSSTLPQAAGQHFHRQQVNTSTGSRSTLPQAAGQHVTGSRSTLHRQQVNTCLTRLKEIDQLLTAALQPCNPAPGGTSITQCVILNPQQAPRSHRAAIAAVMHSTATACLIKKVRHSVGSGILIRPRPKGDPGYSGSYSEDGMSATQRGQSVSGSPSPYPTTRDTDRGIPLVTTAPPLNVPNHHPLYKGFLLQESLQGQGHFFKDSGGVDTHPTMPPSGPHFARDPSSPHTVPHKDTLAFSDVASTTYNCGNSYVTVGNTGQLCSRGACLCDSERGVDQWQGEEDRGGS